ncbi:ACP phosphodiesterase [Rivularia sp. UHCC 0363]|uniref:acyl carrier protein phosphodiesterase n=1 Tax=Rivularia sp. UHCC 0363 TaxID=3110244 RepID=UPI002B2175F5|nr:ACP phosphodiesterase [Rivularia sp. UHCC 0363]MEA5597676.1 ACP phosphodiesterase [Rivularia sp. UHCC 0363]
MNYLAHLFLSEGTTESLIGNLLGDFVKGSIDIYSQGIIKGIYLHRKIDTYTDSHPVFRSSKRLISVNRSRFSGIMIDVFYDHFLAKSWLDYSSISLSDFTNNVYQVLQQSKSILPERLKRILPDMITYDWLGSYKENSTIDQAINEISRRIKRKNNLSGGVEELFLNYQQLQTDFSKFFPELIDYTLTVSSEQ